MARSIFWKSKNQLSSGISQFLLCFVFYCKLDIKNLFKVHSNFEIHRAPSELLLPSAKKICPERLNWPGRLAGISEGARWISKKKSRPFFIIIFKLKNGNFKTRDFSPLIERVLAGVTLLKMCL